MNLQALQFWTVKLCISVCACWPTHIGIRNTSTIKKYCTCRSLLFVILTHRSRILHDSSTKMTKNTERAAKGLILSTITTVRLICSILIPCYQCLFEVQVDTRKDLEPFENFFSKQIYLHEIEFYSCEDDCTSHEQGALFAKMIC